MTTLGDYFPSNIRILPLPAEQPIQEEPTDVRLVRLVLVYTAWCSGVAPLRCDLPNFWLSLYGTPTPDDWAARIEWLLRRGYLCANERRSTSQHQRMAVVVAATDLGRAWAWRQQGGAV